MRGRDHLWLANAWFMAALFLPQQQWIALTVGGFFLLLFCIEVLGENMPDSGEP